MKHHTLDNGLTLLTRQNSTMPIVTLDMWVDVGSGDEPAPIAGISHFLEHMMFKGTPSLAVGEYDKRIEAVGGYLNAATSYDYTHYYIELPSDQLSKALPHFADVLCHSSIDAEEVDRERQVILEEIRRKNDDPSGFLYDSLVQHGIESGPYSHPVIGSPETVSATTAEALREHFQRFYAADSMVLSVSGDFDEARLVDECNRHFADLPKKCRPYRDAAPATRFSAEREKLFDRDWNETYFFLAWPGPATRSLRDSVAADLLETVLAAGRSSRLVNALREKRRLVSAISTYFPVHPYESFYLVGGRCEPTMLREACDAAREEIARLLADGPTPEEEARARRQLVNGHIYHAETNSGVAGLNGYSWLHFGDLSMATEYCRLAREIPMDEALARLRPVFVPGADRLFVTQKGPLAAPASPAA